MDRHKLSLSDGKLFHGTIEVALVNGLDEGLKVVQLIEDLGLSVWLGKSKCLELGLSIMNDIEDVILVSGVNGLDKGEERLHLGSQLNFGVGLGGGGGTNDGSEGKEFHISFLD